MKHCLTVCLVLSMGCHLHAQSFSLNPDFGKNGSTLINFYERPANNFIALGVNLANDGHVRVGGFVNTEAAMTTLGPDGQVDPRFGIKGFSYYDFGSWSSNWIQDILTYPGGKTILIGEQAPCVSIQDRYLMDRGATVMRLLPDGTPDSTFGIRGKAFSFYPYNEFDVYSGIVQPDGKIVVAGRTSPPSYISGGFNRVLLTRFNANGTIDSGFGVNGICLVPQFTGFTGLEYIGKSAIALQANGKIVLGDIMSEQAFLNGGTVINPSPAVYRITTQGTMDSTFGVNGMFFNRFGFNTYGINGLVVQPDGRIVVSAGLIDATTGQSTGWLLYRLDSSGDHVDSSFAQNGLYVYTLGSAGTAAGWQSASAGSIVGTPDGGIVVSAIHGTTYNGALDVFRLTSTGIIDTSFAAGYGYYSLSMPQNYFLAYSKLATDTAGNLAVLGYSSTSTPVGYLLVRLTKAGIPVRSFNSAGYRLYSGARDTSAATGFDFGSDDELRGMVQLGTGRILLTGQVGSNGGTVLENGVVALTAKGKIDSSFGTNGRTIPIPVTNIIPATPRVFYRLDNDEVLSSRDDQTIYKLTSDGKIDSTWGQGGFVALNNGSARLRAVLEQPDKKILVLSDGQLSRLNPDGSFDNSFASQGTLGLSWYFGVAGCAIRQQSDGMIVLAVNVTATPAYLYLYRCSAAGVPDTSFGIAGNGYAQVLCNIPPAYELSYTNTFEDFQILPNGEFIVLSMKDRNYGFGYVAPGATWPALYQQVVASGAHFRDFMIFRLTAGGKIDSSFGGYPVPAVYKGASYLTLPYLENIPATISVDSSTGNLLLSGIFNRGTGWDAGFVTLTANGWYDSTCMVPGTATLGMDNIVVTSRTNEGELPLRTLHLADGTYLVAGSQEGQGPDFFVSDVFPPDAPGAAFARFTATRDTACWAADLSWQTGLECNVDSFVVEYSQDGTDFTRIGEVKANGQGNYSFGPVAANYGLNYYRIVSSSGGTLYGASVQQLFIDTTAVAQIIWNGFKKVQNDSLFDITLQWNTTAQDSATSFEVQESSDTVNFHTIGTVPADDSAASYSFTVGTLSPGNYYFRVLASGNHCRSTTGPILFIPLVLTKDSCSDRLLAWPNPVHTQLTVQVPQCQQGDLRVINVLGEILQIIHHPPPRVILNFSSYSAAPYFLQFIGKTTQTIKILKL